jgi:hypothetical protein
VVPGLPEEDEFVFTRESPKTSVRTQPSVGIITLTHLISDPIIDTLPVHLM